MLRREGGRVECAALDVLLRPLDSCCASEGSRCWVPGPRTVAQSRVQGWVSAQQAAALLLKGVPVLWDAPEEGVALRLGLHVLLDLLPRPGDLRGQRGTASPLAQDPGSISPGQVGAWQGGRETRQGRTEGTGPGTGQEAGDTDPALTPTPAPWLLFETGSLWATHAGMELSAVLLLQPPEFESDKYAPLPPPTCPGKAPLSPPPLNPSSQFGRATHRGPRGGHLPLELFHLHP